MKIKHLLLTVLLPLIMAEIYTMDVSMPSDDQSSTSFEIDQTSDTELSRSTYTEEDHLPFSLCSKLHELMNVATDEESQSIYSAISDLSERYFDVTWKNYSCLTYAIKAGHDKCISRCIELIPQAEKAQIIEKYMNSEQVHPVQKLLFAIVINENHSVMKLLRTNQFDKGVLSTMLVKLVRYSQRLDIFDEFIQLGASINGPTHQYGDFIPDYNPLYNALLYHNEPIVKALRKRGALTGDAFQYALKKVILSDNADLLELLLYNGCPINQKSEFEIEDELENMYPLEAACYFSSESICLRLLEAMHDVEDVADVLEDAAIRGYVSLIKAWLARLGSNQEGINYTTAFQAAVQLENLEMLNVLAEYRAIPVNLISFACGEEYFTIISTMLKQRIDISNKHDAYYACIALYENSLFNEFELLVKMTFKALEKGFDQRSITQKIVRDIQMPLSQRTRLLAFCLADSTMTPDDIKGMVYTTKTSAAPKPVARNLFETDFKELDKTTIPYVSSLLTHREWSTYQKDKKAYITSAFARNNKASIILALQFSAFSLDTSTFDFIITKNASTYSTEAFLENKLVQAQLLRAILYAPSESMHDLNLKLSLFSSVLNLGFEVHEEFIAEAYKYDPSFAGTMLIYKIISLNHAKHIDLINFSSQSNSSTEASSSNQMAVDIADIV